MNLVTIDNEKLWSKGERNLLLGNWCIDNDHRFKKKGNKKYLVSEYHWSNESKQSKDLKYLHKIYNLLLNNLCSNLNKFHNLKYPKRYWEVLLHRWLWIYLIMIYDRWEVTRSIKNKNKNKKLSTKIFDFNAINFVPNNSFEFARSIVHSDDWNHWIYSEILKFVGGIDYRFVNKNKIQPKLLYKKKIFSDKLSNHFLNFPLSRFSSKKIFTRNLYFSKQLRLKFDVLYRQFGHGQKNVNLDFSSQVNLKKRNIFLKLTNKGDSFAKFAYSLIKHQLPKIFFEDYKKKIKLINKFKLPKKPEIIATAGDHHYDDVFKFYTAEKILSGSKYFIFQHGGSYGTSDFFPTEEFDIKISDKFFTWGWKTHKKTYPLFLQKTVHTKTKRGNNGQGLLVPITEFYLNLGNIAGGRPRNKMEVNRYIDNIILFLSQINQNILNLSSFKYTDNIIKSQYVLKSLKFKFPKFKFINSIKNTYAISNNFRLTVETLNSTGFLESLNLNIPVILIFDKKYCSIRKSALKDFNMLKKVKILHDCPIKAAKFVNENYNNLENWWNSNLLQKIKNKFCYKFARKSETPLEDLKLALNLK